MRYQTLKLTLEGKSGSVKLVLDQVDREKLLTNELLAPLVNLYESSIEEETDITINGDRED